MTLDTFTLFTCVTVANIAGSIVLCLLVLAMRNQPWESRHSCILWSSAMLMVGIGCILVGLRGAVSDMFSVVVANALLLLGQGLRPSAIAQFHGQRLRHLWLPALSVGGWLALCLFPPFRESYAARVAYAQGFLLASTVFSAWAVIRLNQKRLVSAGVLAGIMVVEATAFLMFSYSQLTGLHTSFLGAFQTTAMSIYLVAILGTTALVPMAVAAMAIESVQKIFHQDARRDPVTGLANRRELDEEMRRVLRKSGSSPRLYSLAVIEIDQLDHFRETYGESMGDALLKLFSRICRDSLPAKGVIARIGERQFGLFLPERNDTFACALARGIARTFTTASRQASGGRIMVTLSTGVFSGEGKTDGSRALEIADRCLIRAKQQGRNRVVVNEDEMSMPLKSVTVEAPFSTHQRTAA
ncbi:GGDEF domain-containing protein [Roseibium sp.]|uniref:GGDEF domain-containing protein n=1 Tax=Roseibium sp. TaxID=1936156 RepID=UPI003A9703D3